MSSFNETQWANREFAQEYVENADHYIPERRALFDVLRSFYRAFVAKPSERMRVCDLGCGDGVLTEQLLRADPLIEPTLVDASTEMLDAARKRLLPLKQVQFVNASFGKFTEGIAELGCFDLVISGFAIHHLNRAERRALFAAVSRHLAGGGFFLNVDIGLPEHALYTEWQYALWREWIVRHSERLGLGAAFLDVPQKAQANPDNQYTSLNEQLTDLRDAGFQDVECHYKNGIFALYTGRRSESY
jgi:tRNA (cmo5U34)-methyltransferase